MRRTRVLLLTAIIALVGARVACREEVPRSLRVATFNIEDFPKDERQIAGAFAELAPLHADVVALQEIMDPARFERAMRERLGSEMRVVFEPFVELGYRHLGVMFDARRFSLLSTRVHDETRLGARHKAVFEVRLQQRAAGQVFRILVVHLRAGSDGRETRALQHAALRDIVRRATQSGDRVVVLGDFNATDDVEDRADIARLARDTGLRWSTQGLACTAFWRREDGCPRSRLDHIVSADGGRATVHGACAREGCGWQPACPIYREQVSDHCPVVLDFDR